MHRLLVSWSGLPSPSDPLSHTQKGRRSPLWQWRREGASLPFHALHSTLPKVRHDEWGLTCPRDKQPWKSDSLGLIRRAFCCCCCCPRKEDRSRTSQIQGQFLSGLACYCILVGFIWRMSQSTESKWEEEPLFVRNRIRPASARVVTFMVHSFNLCEWPMAPRKNQNI
jgi:hypothetical protein